MSQRKNPTKGLSDNMSLPGVRKSAGESETQTPLRLECF